MSIIATARPDGTGTVTLPTRGEQHVTANTLDDARDELLDLIAGEAAEVGHPLHVEAHDPDATYNVIVHPDGHIEPEQPQAGTTTQPQAAPAATKQRRKPRSTEPGNQKTTGQRVLGGIIAAAVLIGLVGGVAVALSRPAPPAPAAATADAAAAPADPQPEPAAAAPDGADAAAVANDSSVAWMGTQLPADTAAGPSTWTDTRATGFTRTPLGAALAAVHISTHIDPHTGPATFTPAIRNQVLGNTAPVVANYRAAYRAKSRQLSIRGGAPLTQLITVGRFLGWSIPTYTADGPNNVRLLVRAQGRDVEFIVPVRWVDSDWKAAPTIRDGQATFPIATQPQATNQFNAFQTRR